MCLTGGWCFSCSLFEPPPLLAPSSSRRPQAVSGRGNKRSFTADMCRSSAPSRRSARLHLCGESSSRKMETQRKEPLVPAAACGVKDWRRPCYTIAPVCVCQTDAFCSCPPSRIRYPVVLQRLGELRQDGRCESGTSRK